ncbi:MAG TPA: aromatic ring-hydroxylating dioxygenase subunit alpha [Actinobacteria bacterium]|nr:aromatic ring-hydroxylating dioxygenase subunit alpha [Actinomycetota bacterium]HCK79049.1 aromatic ring-hydroxylating dioxygenase subunit alpha [Actinomycetota bacterium]
MLKNFWWPVEFSDNVTQKVMGMQAVGQRFVLWRDSKGEVHCLSDLCIHRGGPLSEGWLTEDKDSVICPYHGWEYGGDGGCTRIPAQPQRNIPAKARVDSYPVVEKYGYVWTYLGDLPEEERPPIPDIPELEDPQYRRVQGSYYWNVSYERALENGMDPSHAAFVHGSRFGNIEDPSVPDFDVTTTPWSGLASIQLKAPPRNLKGVWGQLFKLRYKRKVGDKPLLTNVKAGYYLPNINFLTVPLPVGTMILIDAHVPIDEHRTRSLYIALRSFVKQEWADRDTHRRVQDIFKQDDDVISKQRPEILPYQLSDELHIRSDILQTTYRRRRNELLDMGWGVDMHQIVGDGPRDTYVVIPSPARRENPELANAWISKEVRSQGFLANTGDSNTRGGKTAYEIEEAQAKA